MLEGLTMTELMVLMYGQLLFLALITAWVHIRAAREDNSD